MIVEETVDILRLGNSIFIIQYFAENSFASFENVGFAILTTSIVVGGGFQI